MRKAQLVNNEYYHIFNRGVDKRELFLEHEDKERFFQSICEFNTIDPIGSIFENSFRKDNKNNSLGNSIPKQNKLVEFICYCVNPNHYHFILKQVVDNGIEKFMHRLGIGYTNYFNNRYHRAGSLFQGRYKAVHIDSNKYLLHISAYVNLNSKVHRLGNSIPKWMSSWDEYQNNTDGLCDRDVILDQFNNPLEYKEFAKSSLKDILERKELEKLLLE